MMVPALIAALSSPAPYPFEVRSDIVVKQTHLSVVFLVDDGRRGARGRTPPTD